MQITAAATRTFDPSFGQPPFPPYPRDPGRFSPLPSAGARRPPPPAPDAEERALWVATLRGDPGATRRLIDALTPIIRRQIAHVLRLQPSEGRHRHEVDDVTQDTLLLLFSDGARVLRSWSAGRGASLTGFVGLVAKRRALDTLRAARREAPKLRMAGRLADETPDTAAGPDDRILASQELGQLLALIRARLTPRAIRIFELLFLDQRTVVESAAAMGLSANAIYIWRSRLGKLIAETAESASGREPSPAGTTGAGASRERPGRPPANSSSKHRHVAGARQRSRS